MASSVVAIGGPRCGARVHPVIREWRTPRLEIVITHTDERPPAGSELIEEWEYDLDENGRGLWPFYDWEDVEYADDDEDE